jgi:hypothetical protein
MSEAKLISTPCSLCFGAFEMQYLCMVAERRNCGKQPNGVMNRRYDKQNDFSLNLHGVMGEYAVAKYLGLKLDHSINLSGDDKVADLKRGDETIQVKTNMARWRQCYLYFNSLDLFRANIAVLAKIKSATEVDLVGWVTRDDFHKKAYRKNFGYGERFCLEEEQLRDMQSLKVNTTNT